MFYAVNFVISQSFVVYNANFNHQFHVNSVSNNSLLNWFTTFASKASKNRFHGFFFESSIVSIWISLASFVRLHNVGSRPSSPPIRFGSIVSTYLMGVTRCSDPIHNSLQLSFSFTSQYYKCFILPPIEYIPVL